ncbi:endospore germination permease [Paenibacillus sp. IB182496]|uniref:Endospore germination permease n=1 Tax=Paenibacillus sabuli TaxID=2772509 RepID=A0A927GSL1_9BACL|nr:endospore germination permease [Paenibacillus sabuli]MBD2846135.1 endospore germination permease [Paenibacillus sabuli]
MDSDVKISYWQLFMIFALMNGLISHVVVNPMILDASRRDAWLVPIVAGVPFLLWSVLVQGIMRLTGIAEWKQWLAQRLHPAVAWVLLAPVGLQLYMIGGMTVIHTSVWHTTNYLPTLPEQFLIVSLVTFCAALAFWGLRTIALVSGILLPIVSALGVFVGLFNKPAKDFKLIRPVLEHGWGPVLDGLVYSGSGFVELLFLIVIQHRLKRLPKWWQVASYVLFSIAISIGPLLGAITEFGPQEAALQMISPYEQWRLVQIGHFIEHLDFLSIFQWLSGACIRISLAVYLFVELLPLSTKRARRIAIALVLGSYLSLAAIQVNEYNYYLWLTEFYMPISFVVMLLLSLVWTAAAWGGARRRMS